MPRGLIQKNRAPDDEYYDVPVTTKFSEGLIRKLNEEKARSGVPMSTQIRRAIEEKLSGKPVATEQSLPPNTVTIAYEPDQFQQLAELAEDRGLDVAGLLKLMARRALKVTPRELNTFLYAGFFEDGEKAYDNKKAELRTKREKKTADVADAAA